MKRYNQATDAYRYVRFHANDTELMQDIFGTCSARDSSHLV
jgi:hypothetical protein